MMEQQDADDRTFVSTELVFEMERKEQEKLGIHVKQSNNFQSYVNSVKIFLGNVYLTIPAVFSKTGLIGGIILYVTVALLNTYTMGTIIEVAKDVSKKRTATGEIKNVKSYSDLGNRLTGKKGKIIVDIAMFIA